MKKQELVLEESNEEVGQEILFLVLEHMLHEQVILLMLLQDLDLEPRKDPGRAEWETLDLEIIRLKGTLQKHQLQEAFLYQEGLTLPQLEAETPLDREHTIHRW